MTGTATHAALSVVSPCLFQTCLKCHVMQYIWQKFEKASNNKNRASLYGHDLGLSIQSMYSLIDQWGVSLSAKTIQANKYGSKELHDAEAVDVSKNLLPPAFLSLNG